MRSFQELLEDAAMAGSSFAQTQRTRPDSLRPWARHLGKSHDTVVRYAASGIIPNAYRTQGGQWRAPYSRRALLAVRRKLRGKSRTRRPYLSSRGSSDLVSRGERAKRWIVAYALFLAVERQPLKKEAALIEFEQSFVFTDAEEIAPPGIHLRDLTWRKCVKCCDELGFKKAALLAAYGHAIVEASAGDTREEIGDRQTHGQAKPFGYAALGGVQTPEKRKAKKKGRPKKKVEWVSGQKFSEAKSAVPPWRVIQVWQWITGCYAIKSERCEVCGPDSNHPRAYVRVPKRYRSRQTFYNWYAPRQRQQALRQAQEFTA